MNTLESLQRWYARHCNGEWEHASGITIQTCDNPGWWVKIDVSATPLRERTFTEIAENVDAQRFPLGPRWLSCHCEDGVWHGAGDETRLEHILAIFLDWAESAGGAAA